MHFSFDPVLLIGIVSIIGAIAIVVGVTVAMEAVSRVRNPNPTDKEIFLPQPMRLSLVVGARGRMSEPLQLCFTVADPDVTLIRIELTNQLDKGARVAECIKTAPKVFVAEVEPKIVQRWYNASPYWNGETKQLPIQVFFTTEGRAASRTIWVRMSPVNLPGRGLLADVTDLAWVVEGPC